MTTSPWNQLQPGVLWQRFEELVSVPRPSKQEQAAMDYLLKWAAEHNWRTTRDAIGNLCVHVPGSPGNEPVSPVIIQGHVDIVVADAENAPDEVSSAAGRIPVTRVDVDGEAIQEAVDGGWLRAPYSTLGADNGIGCAAGMAVAESAETPHPPLELLFTVDEEQGMTGVLQLDPAELQLTGKLLINLDTEDDDELTIGCAGGTDTQVTWSRTREDVADDDWVAWEIILRDLKGGHSGVEINSGRANAIRGLVRALRDVGERCPLRLTAVDGGEKRNSIPLKCRATLWVRRRDETTMHEVLASTGKRLTAQFAGRDGPLKFVASSVQGAGPAFSAEDSRQLLDLLAGLPDGVFAMTAEIPELPETSNNVAVVTTKDAGVTIACSSRSSFAAGMQDVLDAIDAVARLAGATAEQQHGYPGWKPNVDSPLAQRTADVYRDCFNSEPHVLAVHAGLECGVLADKMPGLDCISFGPNIRGNHAPGEHVEIASVQKSYRLLTELLKSLTD